MAQKGIFVYRFDYDLPSNRGGMDQWHACIAGYNQDQCQEYLMKLVPNAVVTTISQECALHALSDELRETILESGKRKPGRPKGTTKNKD